MVEGTRLESERTGNRTVGSNPTLSATLFPLDCFSFWCDDAFGLRVATIYPHSISAPQEPV